LESLKDRVLGPAEYEVKFSAPCDFSKLKIPSGVEITAKEALKFRFYTENAAEINPLLLRELSKQEAPVLTLEKTPRTLEEVYLKAMSMANGEAIQ
jgi:hypothetical protein